MLINFDEEEIIKGIVKEYITVADIWIEDIHDSVVEDVEDWLANYGLYTEIVDEIVKRFDEMNIKVDY